MPTLQQLHRATRIVLELGPERDVARAGDLLRRLRVQVVVGHSVLTSNALQAAVLTAVNAGARTFLGGVQVVGASGMPTLTTLTTRTDLGSAAEAVGATLVGEARSEIPTILVGHDASAPSGVPLAVRIEVEGWRAAVSPPSEPRKLDARSAIPPAGILGAALALSEVFSARMGLHPEAARRHLSVSLWEPGRTCRWGAAPPDPELLYLPTELAVIGLGHLGQAYVWAIASLPYSRPESVEIVCHDRAMLSEENISTCLLVTPSSIEKPKVRVAAAWLEERGFRTRMIERRFEEGDRFGVNDPRLVLVGVDSPLARGDIAAATIGTRYGMQVLDVGLGGSPADFDEMVLHSSPFSPSDVQRWRGANDRLASRTAELAKSRRMDEIASANGLDHCGRIQLAGLAVGVPFVGAAAGALVAGEILRRLAGASPMRTLSLRLRDLELGAQPVYHGAPVTAIPFQRRNG